MFKPSLQDYFKFQKVILKVMGISLYDNDSTCYKIYSNSAIVIVVILYTLVESYGLYKFYDDLDVFASIFGISATHMLGIIKVFVLLKNRPQIKKTLALLEEGIFAPNMQRGGSFEVKKILECIATTRKHSLAYWTPMTVVALTAILTPTISRISSSDYRDWKTPFVKFSLFELTKSPDFEIVSFIQAVCLINFAFIISATDLIIVSVIAHLKTQFVILRNAIGRTIHDARKNAEKGGFNIGDNSTIPPVVLHKTLRKIIIYHQSIINLADQFEEQFNYLILSVFVINTLILCFSMYQASLYALTDPRVIQHLLYIVTISVQVFLYCYWGNELSFESQSVAMSCYKIDFAGTYPGFQKDLSMVIMRSQKPVVITAGKFTKLTLMTFLGIIRVSYSYFVVLKQTNEMQSV